MSINDTIRAWLKRRDQIGRSILAAEVKADPALMALLQEELARLSDAGNPPRTLYYHKEGGCWISQQRFETLTEIIAAAKESK